MRIGVLGAGHLGSIHIQQLKSIPEWTLVGFYDPSGETRDRVSSQFGITAFSSMDELFDQCDAIDIVTPTLSHFSCASAAVKRQKHVFIEKPITNTVEEARNLTRLAHEAGVKVQVGHVERFNPAFKAAQPYLNEVRFIETHRLSQFNPRGTDVSVILDLMIHDIDIVLSVTRSSIRRISASGVAVVSETPDIANARIEFDNGCVANLTASRISLKKMRKSRLFQKDAYISVDFLDKKTEVVRMKNVDADTSPFSITIDLGPDKPAKEIIFDQPEVETSNAIREELLSFYHSIADNTEPVVSAEQATSALEVAYQILEKMKFNFSLIGSDTY
ncbi:MAG TPA: Gfo/Idh/MocA family oxidoreductase [Luteibaculaceae bacterium]|nr:Gfo/Idh/MocA family oxidoreductase [Luteibaculaceae bacterium]